METENRYLQEVYRPAFSTEFSQSASEEGSAFVPWIGGNLDGTLCEQYERTDSADNCVRFETLICRYQQIGIAVITVRVHRYVSGIWRCFTAADYDEKGKVISQKQNRLPNQSARHAIVD